MSESYYDRIKSVIELAAEYEGDVCYIDYNGIYFDPKTNLFCWISASGCSCWDGEYGESTYKTLEELCQDMLSGSPSEDLGVNYEPSLNQARDLVQEAKFVWNDIKDKLFVLMKEAGLTSESESESESESSVIDTYCNCNDCSCYNNYYYENYICECKHNEACDLMREEQIDFKEIDQNNPIDIWLATQDDDSKYIS